MAKDISARVLIPASGIDLQALKNNMEDLVPVSKLGKRLWVIEKQAYSIDFPQVIAQVTAFADKLARGEDLLVSDIVNMPHVITEVKRDDDSFTVPRNHFYSPMLVHPSRDWPQKGVFNGAVVVVGDTQSGKTTYLVKELKPDVIIRYSEPQEDVDLLECVCPASSVAAIVTSSIVLSALGLRVAVDSLRGLVYGLSGNAMEGGAIATLFDVIVQFNNLFADVGVTVVLAINPMLSDMSKADRLFKRLEAVAAGGVHIVDRVVEVQSYRCEGGRFRFGPEERSASPSGGRRDPANTDTRAGGFTTMLNMDRLKEDESRDRLAVAMGAAGAPVSPDQPRSSADFTL